MRGGEFEGVWDAVGGLDGLGVSGIDDDSCAPGSRSDVEAPSFVLHIVILALHVSL